MGTIIGTVGFIFVLIWAFRLEINTTKTNEVLARIEKQLEELNKARKDKN